MKSMMRQIEAIQSLQQLPYLDVTKAPPFKQCKHSRVTSCYWLRQRLRFILSML